MKAKAKDTAGQDLSVSLAGDKVRIKTGSHAGERGILQVATDGALSVSLETGAIAPVFGEELTNFSLAARRAWKVMPKRAGRPTSDGPQKKMVSIRIDSQVWELLSRAVELGLIPSREQAINTWLRVKVNELLGQSVD
jgi:hypothetical protein